MRCPIFLLLIISLSPFANAAEHRVPSQYPTIQAGLDACAEGDTVLVAPGIYTGEGNRDLNWQVSGLHLLSEAGPRETVIDCEELSRGILISGAVCDGAVARGFTITHGFASGGGTSGYDTRGGAVHCNEVSAELSNLVLVANHAGVFFPGGFGGAVALDWSDVTMINVVFEGNRTDAVSSFCGGMTWSMGGALGCYESVVSLTDCVFKENSTHLRDWGYDMCCPRSVGGAIYVAYTSAMIRGCLFENNWTEVEQGGASSYGSAIWSSSPISLENCTLSGNTSSRCSPFAGHDIDVSACVLVRNMSSDTGSLVLEPAIGCSVLWENNAALDEVFADVSGNVVADPQFCGVEGSGNYFLQSDSPCLPANNECGLLIGALGPGCDETSVLLSGFQTFAAPGSVTLQWEIGESAEFQLIARLGDTTWLVPWREIGVGHYTAQDRHASLVTGGRVTYHLSARLADEGWMLLQTEMVDVPPASGTRLLPSYPNPFNPATDIAFDLTAPLYVELTIFDIAGRRIVGLLSGLQSAGMHTITWNGCDAHNRQVAGGVYLARLSAPGFQAEDKLVLLK